MSTQFQKGTHDRLSRSRERFGSLKVAMMLRAPERTPFARGGEIAPRAPCPRRAFAPATAVQNCSCNFVELTWREFSISPQAAKTRAPHNAGARLGGSGEIRTHEARESLPVFKTGAFNRSATLPFECHVVEDRGRLYVATSGGPDDR
jgi:hypothetical protein